MINYEHFSLFIWIIKLLFTGVYSLESASLHHWFLKVRFIEAGGTKGCTSNELDVVWQNSILVNKLWEPETGTRSGSKTLINYLYLLNEMTLILVSRSCRKQADLRFGNKSNYHGFVKMILTSQKAHCTPESFITAVAHMSRPGGKTSREGHKYTERRADIHTDKHTIKANLS